MPQLSPLPSSSLPKRPRLSETLDITQPCITLQQKKKKIPEYVRLRKVSVIIVQDVSKGIPRGKYYKKLQQSECVGTVELTKGMSAIQVNGIITRAFSHLPLKKFSHLIRTDQDTLLVNPDQDQDGSKIIGTFLHPLYLLRGNQNTNLQSRVASTANKKTTNVSLYFNPVHVFKLVIFQQDDGGGNDDDVYLPPKGNQWNSVRSDRSQVRDINC